MQCLQLLGDAVWGVCHTAALNGNCFPVGPVLSLSALTSHGALWASIWTQNGVNTLKSVRQCGSDQETTANTVSGDLVNTALAEERDWALTMANDSNPSHEQHYKLPWTSWAGAASLALIWGISCHFSWPKDIPNSLQEDVNRYCPVSMTSAPFEFAGICPSLWPLREVKCHETFACEQLNPGFHLYKLAWELRIGAHLQVPV